MVEVRRTEPGRRGGGVSAGSEGGGLSEATAGAPASQIMFSGYAVPRAQRTFRTTLLAKAQLKGAMNPLVPDTLGG